MMDLPPKTGIDSLFIIVNDSIANPPPLFTSREVVNRNGVVNSYTQSGLDLDSVLTYYEGDSLVITYNATDQDSARGEINDNLTFSIGDYAPFLSSSATSLDSAVTLDSTSILVGSSPRAFRLRLQLSFDVGDTNTVAYDTLVVGASDGTTTTYDSMLIRVLNTNRKPIFDADTSSHPSDSALVWAFSPELVDVDSIEAFDPIPVSNNASDSVDLGKYVYDPDVLIGDSLGASFTFTQTDAPVDAFNSVTGLMVITLSRRGYSLETVFAQCSRHRTG